MGPRGAAPRPFSREAAWLLLVGLAWIALALVTCYEPRFAECVVRCAAATDCAPGQTCGADGWCVTPELAGQCTHPASEAPDADDPTMPEDAGMVDARKTGPKPDAAPMLPDAAAPTCAPGCPGTCQDGVCVIRCATPGSCNADVVCPSFGPCRVECTGTASCQGDVICGSGRCTVVCSGEDSCDEGVRCAGSCACDVACTGNDSCDKAATCPKAACKAGRGCTSQKAGCASC